PSHTLSLHDALPIYLLAPSRGAERCRVRLWASPDLGVVERQVEPPAPGADGHPARPSNSGPIKGIGCATRLALGSSRRLGGRRLDRESTRLNSSHDQ